VEGHSGESATTVFEGSIVQENPMNYLAHLAARAELFKIACGVMRDRRNSDDASSKTASRREIYGEVFLRLRQRALDACEHAPNAEVRAAACKAAFHLNPRAAEKPVDIESESLGIRE
jgi:hypothetical protein